MIQNLKKIPLLTVCQDQVCNLRFKKYGSIKLRITGDTTPPLNIEPIIEPNPTTKIEHIYYDLKLI